MPPNREQVDNQQQKILRRTRPKMLVIIITDESRQQKCDTTEIRTLAPEGTGYTDKFPRNLAGQRDNHSAIVPMDVLLAGGKIGEIM